MVRAQGVGVAVVALRECSLRTRRSASEPKSGKDGPGLILFFLQEITRGLRQ